MKTQAGGIFGMPNTMDCCKNKHIKDRLVESEHKYQTLVQSTPWGIVVHRDGSILFANAAVVKRYGFASADELIGQSLFSMFKIERAKDVQYRMGCLARGDIPESTNILRIQGPNGECIYAKATAISIPFSGEPAIMSLLEDVTDLIQTQIKLSERESMFRTLFDGSPDAIVINRERIPVLCNRQAITLFGRSGEDLMQTPLWHFSPEFQPDGTRSAERADSIVSDVLQGIPQSFEWVHVGKDNKPFNAWVILGSFEFGNVKHLISIVRDITIRKTLERRVIEVQKEAETHRLHLLHDEFGGTLKMVDFALTSCRLRILAGRPVEDEIERIDKLKEYIAQQMNRIYVQIGRDGYYYNTEISLEENIRLYLAEMQISDNLIWRLHSVSETPIAEKHIGGHIMSIIREATNNAIRYVPNLVLDISITRSMAMLRIEISDNGTWVHDCGAGTRSMREHAERIGARLAIETKDRTTICLEVCL